MSVEKRHPSLKTKEYSVLGLKKGRLGVILSVFGRFLMKKGLKSHF
jgi:hypothetical protein